MTDERTTHFGFETVPEDEKAGRVHGVFSSVAAGGVAFDPVRQIAVIP